jgi:hypothetical protein
MGQAVNVYSAAIFDYGYSGITIADIRPLSGRSEKDMSHIQLDHVIYSALYELFLSGKLLKLLLIF